MLSNLDAFRISRPNTFTLPWTQDQVSQLNRTLEDIWNLTNGEFNLDVVTTSKTNAQNGDIWIIYTAPNARIQFKAKGIVHTLSPL